MTTDQLMTVAIGGGTLEILHKSMMGNVKDLIKIGNKHRVTNGKDAIRLDNLLNAVGTTEFKESLKKVKGLSDEEMIMVTGRGRGKSTLACLPLLIYLAERLDSDFHVMVIDTFINSKILTLRDAGGNDFKSLNLMIDTLEDRTKTLKPKGNRGCYINISKLLKEKIFTSGELLSVSTNIWNTDVATPRHQEQRTVFEDKLITIIKMGYIKTYPQLKEAITRL